MTNNNAKIEALELENATLKAELLQIRNVLKQIHGSTVPFIDIESMQRKNAITQTTKIPVVPVGLKCANQSYASTQKASATGDIGRTPPIPVLNHLIRIQSDKPSTSSSINASTTIQVVNQPIRSVETRSATGTFASTSHPIYSNVNFQSSRTRVVDNSVLMNGRFNVSNTVQSLIARNPELSLVKSSAANRRSGNANE